MTQRDNRGARGRIAIIGGGPAGLGAAYGLRQRGYTPVVYEASPEVGGLARSIDLWGERVDLGAHLLQRRDPRIDRLWDDLIGPAHDAVPRRTAVVIGNQRFRYPYDPVAVARRLGPVATAKCLWSFAVRRSASGDQDDLEHWVVSRFGRRLFELFVRDYAEKLFGLPAREIDGSFAGTLIGFQEHASVLHAARAWIRRGHRTTTRMIVRPHGGVGELMDRIAAAVQEGGAIHRGEPVRRIDPVGDDGVRLETNRSAESYAHAIVTLPLPVALIRLTTPPPELHSRLRAMRSRNVVVVYLLVDGPALFHEQWLYLHAPDLTVGRVANFANWKAVGRKSNGPTILAAEIWCDESDDIWTRAKAAVTADTVDQLANAGLLEERRVVDTHIERVRGALPVLRCGDAQILDRAASYAGDLPNLTFTSRPETAANPGVHGSLLQGFEAADSAARRAETPR